MNEYTLLNALKNLFGHVDAEAPAKAIVAAIMRDGVDLNTDTLAEARLSAMVAVALHPEHAIRPVLMTPAERLAVYERLVGIDSRRAAAFRDESTVTMAAVDLAAKARDRDRLNVDARRRELEDKAWRAEKRIAELSPVVDADLLTLERLTSLRGAAVMGTAAAIEARTQRVNAAKAEIEGLRQVAADARAESARLAEMRP